MLILPRASGVQASDSTMPRYRVLPGIAAEIATRWVPHLARTEWAPSEISLPCPNIVSRAEMQARRMEEAPARSAIPPPDWSR